MQFEATRRSSATPNLTPLIDIVFLLLVFFMLTAHFVRDEGLPIELPQAASASSLDDQQMLKIRIDGEGRIFVAETLVNIRRLADYLKPLLAGRSEKRVLIRGDRHAQLGDSVKIIDAARLAGARGVDIVTEQPEPR